MKKQIARATLSLVLLIQFVAIVGVGYELWCRHRAARDFPAPGVLVDIGGRRMQLDCRGNGSPTVVFEAGFDLNGSLSWSLVHDEVARTTRACAYSRAGIMWSDAAPGPRDARDIAEDLHATLGKAGEKGPFVLVGHSLGGPYIVTYTKYFGDEVAGLVFVDASHPDQVARFREVSSYTPSGIALLIKAGVAFSLTGAVRLMPLARQGAPNQPAKAVQAMAAYAPTSLTGLQQEIESFDRSLAEAGTFRQLGERPLHVLTAMAPLPAEALAALDMNERQGKRYQEIWWAMHAEQTAWSSRGRHQTVVDAGHYIQFDRPDIVIEAVRSVVRQSCAQPCAIRLA